MVRQSKGANEAPAAPPPARVDANVLFEALPAPFSVDTFPALAFAGAFMAPPLPAARPTSPRGTVSRMEGTMGLSDVFITQSMASSSVSSAGFAGTLGAGSAMATGDAELEMPLTLEELRNTHRSWNAEFQALLAKVKLQENQMRVALAAASTSVAPPGGAGPTPQAVPGFTPASGGGAGLPAANAPPPAVGRGGHSGSPGAQGLPGGGGNDSDGDGSDGGEMLDASLFGTFQLIGSLSGNAALRGKVGATCKTAEALSDFMAAFEAECADGMAAIIEGRADTSKALIQHTFESDHMYRHRGVHYNFFAQDRNVVTYFGSVENCCKVMSAEIRMYRHLVASLTVKAMCAVPLVALIRLQGISALAWAQIDSYCESNVVAGPTSAPPPAGGHLLGHHPSTNHHFHSPNHSFQHQPQHLQQQPQSQSQPTRTVRAVTKTHLREAITDMCGEALGLLPEHVTLYLSEQHKATMKAIPVVASPELMVVMGDANADVSTQPMYLYNVWKLLPPVDVPRTSTSLQIVSPRSSHGAVEAPATGNVRNRYHFVNRRCEQYVLFLPQALKLLQLSIARGTGPLERPIPLTAFSSLDAGNEGGDASRRATEWLMTTQVPLAATELLDLSEGAKRDKPLTCSTVKAVMHEHGINLRFMSAVYKAILHAMEVRAKTGALPGGSVGGPRPPGENLTATGGSVARRTSKQPPVTGGSSGVVTMVPPAGAASSTSGGQSAMSSPSGQRDKTKLLEASMAQSANVPTGKETTAKDATPKKAGAGARKDNTAPPTDKKRSLRNGMSRSERSDPQDRVANLRQISTVETNAALHLMRVEAVARAFRVVLNEHLRAVQEARYLGALGRVRTAGGGTSTALGGEGGGGQKPSLRLNHVAANNLSLTTLVPHPPGSGNSPLQSGALPGSSGGISNLDSLPSSRQLTTGAASVTTRLVQCLRNLDAVLNKRAAEAGMRVDIGATARSLLHVRFQVESQSSQYLVDLNERFDRDNPALSMDDEEKRKVAELLSLLLCEDAAGSIFWDHCMFSEVWLKYGVLGTRYELRHVNKSMLLARVCELCHLRLAHIDLSDPAGIAVQRDTVYMIGPSTKLIFPSSRVTELTAGRYSVCHAAPRAEVELLHTFDAQEQHVLDALTSIEAAYRSADERKKKGIVEPQAKQMLPLLAKLERLYQYRGEDRRGDHELTRIFTTHCNLVVFYSELRTLWERFGFDGVVYVTCPSCSILFNCTISAIHKCDVREPWTRKIAAEVLSLGIADGKLLNSRISASSEVLPHSAARFCRLGFKNGCWRPSGNRPDEHVLISLPFVRTIVSVELQGSGQGDGTFTSCFQLQHSLDGETFTTYTDAYRHRDFAQGEVITFINAKKSHTVDGGPLGGTATNAEQALLEMSQSVDHNLKKKKKRQSGWNQFETVGKPTAKQQAAVLASLSADPSCRLTDTNDTDYSTFVRQGYIQGNSDDSHVTRIELCTPIRAKYFRVVVGNEDKQSAALRLELYYESHPASGGNPGREGQSERVLPHHVIWEAPLSESTKTTRKDLAQKEFEILKALDETASAIMDVPGLGGTIRSPGRPSISAVPTKLGGGKQSHKHGEVVIDPVVAADFVSLIRPSTEYPLLLQRHMQLLQQWGLERRNDIQVTVYELLRYRLAEIHLLQERGRSGEARSQMCNYMTTLMTNLGMLGTRTTLIAPVMVLTRDILASLGILSSFLEVFFQVVLWAARARHRLLPYILSVLIDAAAVSPNAGDKGRVAEMCTKLLADTSMQLAEQVDAALHHAGPTFDESIAVRSDDSGGAKATTSNEYDAVSPQHDAHAAALMKQFPISARASVVFAQMKARASFMEISGKSTRPADMSYPDW